MTSPQDGGPLGGLPAGLVVETSGDSLVGGEVPAWAVFDPDRVYRYALSRQWDTRAPTMLVTMLNPSTADAFRVDPTVLRCIRLARHYGCGRLLVGNLFAARSSTPDVLPMHPDPVGPHGDVMLDWLIEEAGLGALRIAAWGANRFAVDRARWVVQRLHEAGALWCWGVTRHGFPIHPSARGKHRIPDDTTPEPYHLEYVGARS